VDSQQKKVSLFTQQLAPGHHGESKRKPKAEQKWAKE
jgi:hypothetical protein